MNPYGINLHINRVTQVKKKDLDQFCFTKFYFYSQVVQWVEGKNHRIPSLDVNPFKKKYIVMIENITRLHWRLIIVCNHSNIKECRDYLKKLSCEDTKEDWKKPYPVILVFESMKKSRVIKMEIKKHVYRFLELCHDKYGGVDENSNPFSVGCYKSELEEKSKVMPIVFPSNSEFFLNTNYFTLSRA